ncbi:MAG: lipid-A-disaccharide synthase [Pseudomonadota bacterium]
MRVFILAGEPSGDRLGGALMAGLRVLRPEVTFQGIGGAEMQAQGLVSLFPMDELSVMGLAEVLPKYRALKARIRETAQATIDMQPDVLITIDSPDFSFRVAKLVKASSRVRTVHYVAPTVWAWRPKRAEKISHFIDHLLAVLPFEPPLFERHGMECDFVGHPVVAEMQASAEQAAAFRSAHAVGEGPMILALPGSRRGEVARLAPIFGEALAELGSHHPRLKVVVPAAVPVVKAVKAACTAWRVESIVLDPTGAAPEDALAMKRAAFRAADAALAASGTVSLELAAARAPMVIAYRMNPLSFQLIQWMALIDTVTLVNLVSKTRVVPEFLGPKCVPEDIAGALANVLSDPQAQRQAMEKTMRLLGEGGEAPGLRAARAVLARV